MFRPPVERGMQSLNRAFFQKTVPLAAAMVFENKQIAGCRKQLGRDVLEMDRIAAVQSSSVPGSSTTFKSVLLRPEIRPDGMIDVDVVPTRLIVERDSTTWTPAIKELLEQQKIAISKYDLKLDYDYWTYRMSYRPPLLDEPSDRTVDIMKAILPKDAPEELPTGFSTVGHIGGRDHPRLLSMLTGQSASEPPLSVPTVQAPHCSGDHRQEPINRDCYQQD